MFTVFTKPMCLFCLEAKELLESKGFDYIEKDVTEPKNLTELKDAIPNVRTVPQIYDGDIYVGGFVDLKDHLKETYDES